MSMTTLCSGSNSKNRHIYTSDPNHNKHCLFCEGHPDYSTPMPVVLAEENHESQEKENPSASLTSTRVLKRDLNLKNYKNAERDSTKKRRPWVWDL